MLTRKQLQFIDYMVEHPTALDVDAHNDLGIAKKTISAWKRDDEFCEAYNQALRKVWQSYVPEALKKMKELMNCGRSDIEYKAAQYLMDTNGFKATDKVEVSTDKPLSINIDYGDK